MGAVHKWVDGQAVHSVGAPTEVVRELSPHVPKVTIAGVSDVARTAMEQYIAAEFLQQYGANVKIFMPWLLGLSCDGEWVGVAGLRPAGSEALFIEQYLDRETDAEIALQTGDVVPRRCVLEIGNLAGHYPGVTRTLFPLLTELIYARGYQWSVCNTTPAVRNALSRLKIPFVALARALPERLGTSRFAWGSYYAQETMVIAIPLAAAHAALQQQPSLATACADALAGWYDALPFAA